MKRNHAFTIHAALWLAIAFHSTALHAAEPGAFKLTTKNGAMTHGEGAPDDWGGEFGVAEVAGDAEVFKAGPASLPVTVGGGKSGQAFANHSATLANASVSPAGVTNPAA